MEALPHFALRPTLTLVFLGLIQLPLFAQTPPVEMKLRVVPVDGPTRRTDNNFQMAGTCGFSVAQVIFSPARLPRYSCRTNSLSV